MVEIEPAPPASGPAKDKTGGEQLHTPIELLDDAHLCAIRRDSPGNNTRPADMPERHAETHSHDDQQNGKDDARSDSHGTDADYLIRGARVKAGRPPKTRGRTLVSSNAAGEHNPSGLLKPSHRELHSLHFQPKFG